MLKRITCLVLLPILAAFVGACSDAEDIRTTRAGSYIVTEILTTVFESDVRENNGSVVSDNQIQLEVSNRPKLTNEDIFNAESDLLDVKLYSYTVSFEPIDGSEFAPLPFTADLDILVEIGGTTTFQINLVPVTLKSQPPLVNLAGTNNTLTCSATVEVVGKNALGESVRDVSNLTIIFADFIN